MPLFLYKTGSILFSDCSTSTHILMDRSQSDLNHEVLKLHTKIVINYVRYTHIIVQYSYKKLFSIVPLQTWRLQRYKYDLYIDLSVTPLYWNVYKFLRFFLNKNSLILFYYRLARQFLYRLTSWWIKRNLDLNYELSFDRESCLISSYCLYSFSKYVFILRFFSTKCLILLFITDCQDEFYFD